jgi:multidrug efflux pump subunit AcrA (membrane-fusion protein)
MSTDAPPKTAGAPPGASAAPSGAPERGQVSPDELDHLLTLVRPRVWLVLSGLLLLVALAVVWAFVGTVTQTVSAPGVIRRGPGAQTVQAPAAGTVVALNATLGGTVVAGEPLATIRRAEGGLTVVSAPVAGVIAAVATAPDAVVAVADPLAVVQPTAGALTATVVVPVDDRSEIFVGDEVRVAMTGIVDKELGYVHGRIATIDSYPASNQELVRIFGGQTFATELTHARAVYLVRVELLTDPTTKSGLRWSSRSGASVTVPAGQLVDASIIVSDQSLIQQVFP